MAAEIAELETLLHREREALLNGRFDILEELAACKERLAGRLAQQQPTDRGVLMRLHEGMMHNRMLLEAAASGIRTVTRRLARKEAQRSDLKTYDAHGKRHPSAPSLPRHVHRA